MLKVEEDVLEEEDDVTETEATAAEEPILLQVTEDLEREAQLLTKLSAEQIRFILEGVCTEMLSGVEVLATVYLRCS